jgi:hypothetical protein
MTTMEHTMSLSHDELPLPDYDHVPLGHLPARIAPLTTEQVQQLIDYETEHGNRLPVQVVLENRLEALRNGAEPSGSVQTDFAEVPPAPGASGVSPQTAIRRTRPSHGDAHASADRRPPLA